MKIYQTSSLPKGMGDELQQSIYNGMDSLLTKQVYSTIKSQLRPDDNALTYKLERLLLGPVLQMVRRGIQIDPVEKERLVHGDQASTDTLSNLGLIKRARRLSGMERVVKNGKASWKVTNDRSILQRLAKVIWGKHLNYHSAKQLNEFFYEALSIPPIFVVKKGERKISTDREALEKIKESYVRGVPFVNIILKIRDLEKQADVLTKGLSPTGRWAAGYNIGGTDTGRWSSSDNPLRHSANVQNIDPALRRVFTSDEGWTLIQCDQAGAEARAVGYLSGDENYIRALESGDVHTWVAAMAWGFEPLRHLADREFYDRFTYRDMAKKFTHGSSYRGKPKTIAAQAGVATKLVEDFQSKFFTAFPGIRDWQDYILTELQSKGILITPFGRRRQFWDRLTDDATGRAAIAFVPQSVIGDLTAIALYKLWYYFEPHLQILANGHDAAIFQIRNKDVDKLLPEVLECLKIPVPVTDIKGKTRDLLVPWEAKLGNNWSDYHSLTNPCGLMSKKMWEAYAKMESVF